MCVCVCGQKVHSNDANPILLLQDDGKTKVIHVDSFTEDLFSKMVDQLLNNRDKDLDVVFSHL